MLLAGELKDDALLLHPGIQSQRALLYVLGGSMASSILGALAYCTSPNLRSRALFFLPYILTKVQGHLQLRLGGAVEASPHGHEQLHDCGLWVTLHGVERLDARHRRLPRPAVVGPSIGGVSS